MKNSLLLEQTIDRLKAKHNIRVTIYWESYSKCQDLLGRSLGLARAFGLGVVIEQKDLFVYIERAEKSVALMASPSLFKLIGQKNLDRIADSMAHDMRNTWDHNAIAMGFMQLDLMMKKLKV